MIRRKIFLALVMLMAAVGMSAQSLVGTWKTVISDGDRNIDVFFTFGQQSLDMKTVVTFSESDFGTGVVSVVLPGTYTHSANTINMEMNVEKATLSIDKMDFAGETAEMVRNSPEMKKMIENLLKQTMESQKGDLVKNLPTGGTLTIKQLTDTTLQLGDDDGGMMTFTRVK